MNAQTGYAASRRMTCPDAGLGSQVGLHLVGDETDRVAVHAQIILPGCLVLAVNSQHLESADLVE